MSKNIPSKSRKTAARPSRAKSREVWFCRLSYSERRMLAGLARKAGITASTLVRDLIAREHARVTRLEFEGAGK